MINCSVFTLARTILGLMSMPCVSELFAYLASYYYEEFGTNIISTRFLWKLNINIMFIGHG